VGIFPSMQRYYVGLYYLLFTELLQVLVVRPSSSRNIYIYIYIYIYARNYSTDNGCVVFRILVSIMDHYGDQFD
jgi:hypothetical protein